MCSNCGGDYENPDMTAPLNTLEKDFARLEEIALKVKADRDALFNAAFEALELIEGYVDVVDGDYGQPRPNKAMQAKQILEAAINKAKKKAI